MPVNSFSLAIDAATGVLSIDGISGVSTHPNTAQTPTFLGITPGSPIGAVPATNPGSIYFTVGPGLGPGGTGMLYSYVAPGLFTGPGGPVPNHIDFIPSGTNYDWIGL